MFGVCDVDSDAMRLPKWRKATWAIAIWSALMITWAVAGGNSANGSCKSEGSDVLSTQTVSDACDIGTGIGVALIIVLWFVGFIVLALIWLMSRPKAQQVVMITPEQAAAAGYAPVPSTPAPAVPMTATRADAVDELPAPFAMEPRPLSGGPLGPYGR